MMKILLGSVIAIVVVLLCILLWVRINKTQQSAPPPPVPVPVPVIHPIDTPDSKPRLTRTFSECVKGRGSMKGNGWIERAIKSSNTDIDSSLLINSVGCNMWWYGGMPTCVGASASKNKKCPATMVCVGEGGTYGSAEKQMLAVEAAKNAQNGLHPSCKNVGE